MRQVTR